MNASHLFAGHAPLETSEWSMLLVPVVLYWTVSTLFYVLSRLKLTRFELHRIQTNQKMRPSNKVSMQQVIYMVLMQHALQLLVGWALAIVTRPQEGLRSLEPWPVMACKVVLGMLMLDTYEYWMHRWFHVNRFLYRHFHSVHHELTAPFAFGALYNHPVEGLLMDTLGAGLPALLLDMHPWTATFFFSISTLKTVDDHCGYALPYDPLQILFWNNAAHHDRHHWGKGNMYNFSQPFFTFWDVWMGTHYDLHAKKQ